MSQRFFYKTTKKKYVKPISNRNINKIKINKTEDMISQKDIDKINDILDDYQEDKKSKKNRVKIEKKEKGIIERTEDSRIILDENNKMLLND